MATWQSEDVLVAGALSPDPAVDVDEYQSQEALTTPWASGFSPTFNANFETEIVVDNADDVNQTAFRNNSPVWLNTQTYVDTSIRFVGDKQSIVIVQGGSSGSATKRYVMTGFYRTTGQYENWIAEDPTSPSPTGHSLVNIAVVAIAKS